MSADFLKEHRELSRRYFFGLGAAGVTAWSLLPEFLRADDKIGAMVAHGPDYISGKKNGSLSGLTFAVKDLFDIAGYPCTANSRVLADAVAEEDADVVRRLRTAGAVIVGTGDRCGHRPHPHEVRAADRERRAASAGYRLASQHRPASATPR